MAPCNWEAPRDQYAGAVETMRNKIREGKVPGVTDPAEASRLIRRGHLTYTQARNITRFGTIESVTYDIAEGSVVSLAAGGIKFARPASVFWPAPAIAMLPCRQLLSRQEKPSPAHWLSTSQPSNSTAQCCSGYAEAH